MFRPIILSGGSGTRLWPSSQKDFPKQFTNLLGDTSLLQQTYQRCVKLSETLKSNFETEISICTSSSFSSICQDQIKSHFDHEVNLILEPEGRDTGAAVCGIAKIVDPNDLVLICPADHYIPNVDQFILSIITGIPDACNGNIVTFGVVPTYPETGYGYIQADKSGNSSFQSHKIVRFTEKPDRLTAEKFIQESHFYWNSGIFLFKAGTILNELEKHDPEFLNELNSAIDKPEVLANEYTFNEGYSNLRKTSIDILLMEKINCGIVVPADFIWSDVGSWKSVHQISDKDESNNVVNHNETTLLDSSDCYVQTNKRVTLVGVHSIGIIETETDILVLNLDDSQKVKSIAK